MTTEVKALVIDADAHVLETERTWDYLEPSEEKYRPKLFSAPGDPKQYWVIDGKIRGLRFPSLTEQELDAVSRKAGRNVTTAQAAREMGDVGLRIEHMDKLGVDVQVLHNTMWIEQVADKPEAEAALCGAWNRWLADIWKQGNGRLRWSAVMPTMTISEAIGQARFAKENGAAAICVRPFEGSRMLTDPYFYPLYEEANKLDLAVAVHLGNGSPQLCDAFRMPDGGGFGSFRVPTVFGCFALIMSEVPRIFPDLRWGFIEVSAQWVPWVVHETVRRSVGRAHPIPPNPLKAFNIYVAAQTDDDFAYLVSTVGEDNLLIGTDYGHTDVSSEVDAIRIFQESVTNISETAKRKILSDNPKKLYAI